MTCANEGRDAQALAKVGVHVGVHVQANLLGLCKPTFVNMTSELAL